jgi:cytochrome c6
LGREETMKRMAKIAAMAVCASLAIPAAALYGAEKSKSKGAELFRQHCSACHPDGGNIIKPALTLHKKEREARGFKTAKDIVGKMRNPGPGMTRFDAKTMPDKDAMEIAEYILNTYK